MGDHDHRGGTSQAQITCEFLLEVIAACHSKGSKKMPLARIPTMSSV
jgi:hypothetical protein